jgi:DNA helicase-2/ATP-dependent DNA helicase PcrA
VKNQAVDILKDLTPEQREAATHVEGPLLVLAGAGSGKTRVVTRRIGYMLSRGVSPLNILAITFTNKAADEMRERVSVLTRVKGLRISTFHSFCAREIRQFAERLGVSPSYVICDTADKVKLIRDCMVALDIDTSKVKPSSVESTISRAKNDMLTPDEYAGAAKDFYGKQVAKVYARYEEEMRGRGALDFDDLLLRMVELLEDEEVREMLERQFRFISVDEYQDTNRAQYLIVRALTRENKNLCVTGDPDQAIYGWRGADISNILSFERDYPQAKTVLLERNYRSTKTILAAAHDLIVHNTMRKEKMLFTENERGSRVKLLEAELDEMEAAAVAERIRELIAGGTPPHDVAVFYRVNALSRPFELALREAKVPYRVVAGVSFFERREVRDVLAYLRLLASAADDGACERIVNVPARAIGKTTMERVAGFARANRVNLFAALARHGEIENLNDAAHEAIAGFVKLIGELGGLVAGGPHELLKAVIERTGYLWMLTKSEEDESRRSNVAELVNAAASYEEAAEEPTLRGFLDQVALTSDQDELDDESPAVSLMTLHAAKGLEFPAVFIVGLEDGTLPHERSGDAPAELEEERRLFYVGMTRAKRELTLSLARLRRRYGEFEPREPSRFIQEISAEHIERVGTIAGAMIPGRKKMPAAPEPAEKTTELAAGDMVRHAVYGVGKVQTVSGSGKNFKVAVRFETAGLKTLMVAYAKLDKLTTKP